MYITDVISHRERDKLAGDEPLKKSRASAWPIQKIPGPTWGEE